MKILVWLLIFNCWNYLSVFGQQLHRVIPASLDRPMPVLAWKAITPASVHHVSLQDKGAFAHLEEVDFSSEEDGEWTKVDDVRIWRLGIQSTGASSLYLTFSSKLGTEASIYLYGPGYKNLLAKHNLTLNRRFSLSPIFNDSLIIEINVPASAPHKGALHIHKIYSGFAKLNQANRMATCSENINCENGDLWQTEKRSVCKIISNGQVSTGTLIGNTNRSDTPYLITSNHSIYNENIASEALFIFNYEANDCNDDTETPSYSISGGALVSTNKNLDVSLIRLYEIPPKDIAPYYAGWSIASSPPKRSACIHHPYGKKKEVAIEYHSASSSQYSNDYDSESAWKIDHWEIGTTEPGSSGAGLFNQDHQLTGTLTGGRASCSSPTDDYFSKLSLAWDKYQVADQQLKHWLDESNTGITAMQGYDPYGFNPIFCDTVYNSDRELTTTIAAYNYPVAEKFYINSPLQIQGCYLDIDMVSTDSPPSTVTLHIWEGSKQPEKEIYTQSISTSHLTPNMIKYINFDSALTINTNFFIGYDSDDIKFRLKEAASAVSTIYTYTGGWTLKQNNQSLRIGLSECYGSIVTPSPTQLYIYPNPSQDYFYLRIPQGEVVYELYCYNSKGDVVKLRPLWSEKEMKISFELPEGYYVLKLVTENNEYAQKFLVLP
ncbi:T9SS type A sorting domain-containing protein [Fulvivirga sediminis]|uniref:Trypsin-like peptidase domain-containing protein n=1 Tax=Fulvivirga sediminis TaxID=2803949 RepID=A0A937K016_9BACT|nr:T9SS type A sorting domain-containing protein [Fulvivirga sediminis]MBL3657204.1 trypsin-like peptidase domain-containing protein [Fulvivirga sediminis]